MPHPSYSKGYRGEREVLQILRDAGIPARRVPLSGGAPGSPNDLIVGEGADEERWEVKRRKKGFKRIYVEARHSRRLRTNRSCSPGHGVEIMFLEWWVVRNRFKRFDSVMPLPDWYFRTVRRWLEDCEVVAFRVDYKPWLVGVRV